MPDEWMAGQLPEGQKDRCGRTDEQCSAMVPSLFHPYFPFFLYLFTNCSIIFQPLFHNRSFSIHCSVVIRAEFTVQLLFPHCFVIVPFFFHHCSIIVTSLFCHCSPILPSSFRYCSNIIQLLFTHCFVIIPPFFHHRFVIVPSLFSHCSLIVPSLFHHCSIIVTSVFPHCSRQLKHRQISQASSPPP